MLTDKLRFLASLNSEFTGSASGSFYSECFATRMSALLKSMVVAEKGPVQDKAIPVIFQVKPGHYAGTEKECLANPDCEVRALRLINGYSVTLSPSQIHLLVRSDKIDYVTLDACVEAATGTESTGYALQDGPLRFPPGGDQEPIGIALLDSALPRERRIPSDSIRLALDFTSGTQMADLRPAEHSSVHAAEVADTIMRDFWNRSKPGLESQPGLEIIALQVVGADNCGLTSDLIRAVDWVIENRQEFGIRIANLSLSHSPIESHLKDPLCQAVRKMVESGIVTIVSSHKQDERYRFGEGSPGMEPAAITVTTDFRTLPETQKDQQWEGSLGADRGYKPDLFVGEQPRGDSLAAATVTATVARMLAANEALTPTIVKSVLLSTATRSGPENQRLVLNPEAAVELTWNLRRSTGWSNGKPSALVG